MSFEDFNYNKIEENTFFVELLMSSQERIFLKALQDDPNDEALRAAYSDWLKENHRENGAKLIEEGYVPGMNRYAKYRSSPMEVTSGAIRSGHFAGVLYSGNISSGQITTFHVQSGS